MYVFSHVHYTGLDPKLHYLSQGYAILRVVELKKIGTVLPQHYYITVTNYYEIFTNCGEMNRNLCGCMEKVENYIKSHDFWKMGMHVHANMYQKRHIVLIFRFITVSWDQ